jgi:uncharacterized membrane protein YgcG
MKINPVYQLLAVVACFATCAAASAQEAITLQEDGSLKGKAFVAATDEAVDAKITLSQDGEVVSTVATDEKGNFSFANVEPGVYNMVGTASPYVGSAAVTVAPYAQDAGCSVCNMGLTEAAPEVAYETCGSAPAASCGCGGGGVIGGGGGGYAGGGGGLLGGGGGLLSRPLLGLGVAGGIIAVAVSDDDDDASPTN